MSGGVGERLHHCFRDHCRLAKHRKMIAAVEDSHVVEPILRPLLLRFGVQGVIASQQDRGGDGLPRVSRLRRKPCSECDRTAPIPNEMCHNLVRKGQAPLTEPGFIVENNAVVIRKHEQ